MLARLKTLLELRAARRPAPPGLPATRWLVLEQGSNPSTDYYIRPQIEASGLPACFRHIDRDMPQEQDLAPGTRVVIVRYLTPAWAEALRRRHAELAEVIYFMDDELLEPRHWKDLPAAYRKKLDTYCRRMRPAIQRLCHSYWGSTPQLCARHAALGMRHIAPQALPEDRQRAVEPVPATGPVHIFYHGSSAHLAEMEWLQPVMAEVLAACPRAHFEIIGNHGVNKRFRGLPRTRILHPMSWPNYLAHCRAMSGHIGLAPLLPGPFNGGRSHTRIFDITRHAATGLYADAPPYAGHVPASQCLPMESTAWRDALIRLCR
ncbi:MAG: hypothetical protein REI09_10360 [Candidatus Dactylopiibacterium sp.]|nr:hypothetical protein [Candidatus Dactylopiibacterium sp.]